MSGDRQVNAQATCKNCRKASRDLCGDGFCVACHFGLTVEECRQGFEVERARRAAGRPIVPRLPDRHGKTVPLQIVKSDLYPHFDADGALTHVCWRLSHGDRVAEGRATGVVAAYVAIQAAINEWFPPEIVSARAMVIRPMVDGGEHEEVLQ